MNLTPLQQNVLSILVNDTNEKSPITGWHLAKRAGFLRKPGEDKGGMRGVIHALRKKNFPICASNGGYFYARTDDQLSKFIIRLSARMTAQEEALTGLKGAFHNVGSISASEAKYTKRVALRTPAGTMVYQDFPLDKFGQPDIIIPEGYSLL